MEFRILGPVEVLDGGRAIPIRRLKQRALLAALVLRPGEVVSADRLVDDLWGDNPPAAAKSALQNYVSQLRQALGADVLVTRPGGYALDVEAEQVDLSRFERLVSDSRSASPEGRAAKLREALALWHGPPLADLAFEPFAAVEIPRLEELRLAAREELIDADLELGRHADLAGELESLVAEHPLRERLRRQLMLALYRSGRQAEALRAYQEARHALVEELGIEPSAPLRDLEQAILRQDPALALTPAEAPLRRRTVTVVLFDLACSRVRGGEVDPERVREATGHALVELRQTVDFHGGVVESRAGDEAMAVFGLPVAHEDDALRAVRATFDIRDAIASLSDVLAQTRRVRLELRVGIATGEIVTGAGGFAGQAVTNAKSLARKAAPDEILLQAPTRRLLGATVDAEPTGAKAYRALELVEAAPALARRPGNPLIGRDAELARLRDVYGQVGRDRRCRVVTIVGEPGIGKTRLAAELAASVRGEATVATGRCVSYGQGATFLPVAEIVKQVAGEEPEPAIATLLRGDEHAETVARRVAELVGAREGAGSTGESFWAVRRLVEALARERPLVVLLDDVHWAEPTLLDLVEYLGRQSEDAPILVLCLARPELLDARPGWTEASLALEPLPDEDSRVLVEALAGADVPEDVRARVVEVAAGNPLFVEQLLAYVAEVGKLESVPPSVDALLASRLDLFARDERAVLERAAVAGKEFWRAAVAALSPTGAVASLGANLRTLTEKGLVRPSLSSVGRDDAFTFHHVLVRDVVYAGIAKHERAALHERFADWLADEPDAPDELVGYHLEQAYRYLTEADPGDRHARRLAADAGARLGRAGIRAWKRGDTSATVNLLSRATSLLPERDATRRELLCELGIAVWTSGDVEQALAALREAAGTSALAGDRRVELRARVELANVQLRSDPQGRADELLALAADALPTFDALDDNRSLGRTWLLVSYVHGGLHCRNVRWQEAAESAVIHYRLSGWSPSTCLGEVAAALYHGPTTTEEAIDRCEALLEESTDERGGQASILTMLGGLEAMRGRFKKAMELIHRAMVIYEDLGRASSATNAVWVAGDIELLASDPAAAEAFYREGCQSFERMAEKARLSTLAADLAEAIYAQGRYEEADRWTRISEAHAASDDVGAHFSWRSVRAKILARSGRFAEGEELAREAVALAGQTDALNQHAKVTLDLGEVLRLCDRLDEAAVCIEKALGLYERKGNVVAAGKTRTLLQELAVV